MGRNQTGVRKYQIEQVWEVHREIARRILLGEKNVDIAKSLKCSSAMVSYTRNSYLVKAEIARLAATRDGLSTDIAQDIQDLTPLALQTVTEVMTGVLAEPAVKLRAGFGILDRGGFSPVKKQLNVNGTLTRKDIEDIKKDARENGFISGVLVKESDIEDVESEDIN